MLPCVEIDAGKVAAVARDSESIGELIQEKGANRLLIRNWMNRPRQSQYY